MKTAAIYALRFVIACVLLTARPVVHLIYWTMWLFSRWINPVTLQMQALRKNYFHASLYALTRLISGRGYKTFLDYVQDHEIVNRRI